MDVHNHDLPSIYAWVDTMPLSRPKRNIHRDFADAVMVAEIVAHCLPGLVHLHNYSACSALHLKLYNWSTLNDRAFRKLGFVLTASECHDCATAKPGAIERVLRMLQYQLQDSTQLLESSSKWQHRDGPCNAAEESCTDSMRAGTLCGKAHSISSQLEAAQQDEHLPGSVVGSTAVMLRNAPAGIASSRGSAPALQGIAGEGAELGSTAATECGAESIAAIEDRKGPEDITSLSVELVEGALGESADFRIATYGMEARDGNSLKPSPFNTSSDSLSDRDDAVLALQKSLQEMERRTVELQTENECLRRIGTLHMQRCLLLEDICYKNGLHVPGGLVVHHKQGK